MGKIIMCGSFKGGVGKSVTTFNLAYSLAEIGKNVLCVNFDSQANPTTCFGVEDVEALPVTIGHLMMAEIEEDALSETVDYIHSRNGVDFIPYGAFGGRQQAEIGNGSREDAFKDLGAVEGSVRLYFSEHLPIVRCFDDKCFCGSDVEMLDIDLIKPFWHHPFHLYEGEWLIALRSTVY